MQENVSELLDFFHIAEKLKTVYRHCWKSDGSQENSAEHSWRSILITFILEDYFSENIDSIKIMKMLTVHDLGEIVAGDFPELQEKPEDRHDQEKAGIEKIVKNLPEKTKNKILSLWLEFEEQKTKESIIARAIDKLEAVIQHNDSDMSFWNSKEYVLNLTYGDEECSIEPFLIKLRLLIREETEKKIATEGRLNETLE